MGFPELYKPYNDQLIAEIGLDWFEVRDTLTQMQNGPGLYPDTALFLVEVIKRLDVSSIVEFGSGASTLFIAKACQKFGKSFTSLEEMPRYQAITQQLLDIYKVDFKVDLFGEVASMLIPEADLLFLDSLPDSRISFLDHESVNINNFKYILLDDAEDPQYYCPVARQLGKVDRWNNYMFNPIGRQDRSLLINCKDPTFNINEWCWSWKPAKVFW